MFKYQILVEYVGTNFRGWQIQKKGKTIQGLIQEKVSNFKRKIILLGSEEQIQVFMLLNNQHILNVKMKLKI
ncbi:MAG: hypothetical protein CM15mV132_360 [uncultured marine virus]|nr:MAG: hypothetical protein CM15mV132_360 [uncultured marine virus]